MLSFHPAPPGGLVGQRTRALKVRSTEQLAKIDRGAFSDEIEILLQPLFGARPAVVAEHYEKRRTGVELAPCAQLSHQLLRLDQMEIHARDATLETAEREARVRDVVFGKGDRTHLSQERSAEAQLGHRLEMPADVVGVSSRVNA